MLRLVAAALALLLVGASDVPTPSSGDAKTQGKTDPSDKHNDSQTNQRGTPSAPFIIQFQQPPNEHAVTAEAKGHGKWYANPDWWVAGATIALVFATAGLWLVTGLTWRQLRKDSIVTHRPRLRIRRVSLDGILARIQNMPLTNGQQFECFVSVSNIGGSTAKIISGRYRIYYAQDVPVGRDPFEGRGIDIVTSPITIPAGMNSQLPLIDTLSIDDADAGGGTMLHRLDFDSGDRMKIIVLGNIWYDDGTGIRRAIGFHREMHSDYRFRPVKDSDFEYED